MQQNRGLLLQVFTFMWPSTDRKMASLHHFLCPICSSPTCFAALWADVTVSCLVRLSASQSNRLPLHLLWIFTVPRGWVLTMLVTPLLTSRPMFPLVHKIFNVQIGITFTEDIHVPQRITSFHFRQVYCRVTEGKVVLFITFGLWHASEEGHYWGHSLMDYWTGLPCTKLDGVHLQNITRRGMF